jgi:predicted RNase H-like HicB family nuclease
MRENGISSPVDRTGTGCYTNSMVGQFTAVYMKRGRRYVAFVEEIPGVNTQGRTLAETKANLKEALELVIQANREIAHKTRGRRVLEEPISIVV